MAMQASKQDVRRKSPIRRHSTTIGINSPPQRPNHTNDRLNFGSSARGSKVYRKTGGNFDDVKFDVTNAITNRGLVADFTGNVGAMLDRTGKDVGSTKQVYKRAEYVVFCSAKLSRDMMEADVANAGFCPYIVFIYETAAKPGEIVIGYRRLPRAGKPASIKAFSAINALLDGIAKEAVK